MDRVCASVEFSLSKDASPSYYTAHARSPSIAMAWGTPFSAAPLTAKGAEYQTCGSQCLFVYGVREKVALFQEARSAIIHYL